MSFTNLTQQHRKGIETMRISITSLVVAATCLALAGCAPKATTSSSQPGATADTGRNALDWAGTYTGVVPCADCEGIETSITLGSDARYLVKTKYLGRGDQVFERRGTFTWNEAGNTIQLQGMADGPGRYLVGENALIQLDKQAQPITGDLALRYVLSKTDVAAPMPAGFAAPASWRLTELQGKPVAPPEADKQVPSLAFDAATGQVSGFAGCNRLTGKPTFAPGNRIRFGNLAVTRMACPDMTMEDEFLKVLEAADSYFQEGSALVLHRARMAPLARFEAVSDQQP